MKSVEDVRGLIDRCFVLCLLKRLLDGKSWIYLVARLVKIIRLEGLDTEELIGFNLHEKSCSLQKSIRRHHTTQLAMMIL